MNEELLKELKEQTRTLKFIAGNVAAIRATQLREDALRGKEHIFPEGNGE